MRTRNLPMFFALAMTLFAAGGCDKDASTGGSAATTNSAGPGGAGGRAKATIGVSLMTLTNPFFKEVGDAMRDEASRHGYDVLITSAEMDPAKQRDQVKDFIVSKVSVIVLTPVDSRSVGTAIVEANQAGIPVFTADVASMAPEAKVVSHIATDNYGGGREAAKAIIEALGGNGGKVAVLDHPQVESVMLRTKGFEDELKANPGGAKVQVVARLPGGGLRDPAFKAAEDVLQSHPDLAAIFAINDPSALGAVAAIEKAGKSGEIKVVGFDGQPEAKRAIREGKIYADAIQYPKKIGSLTIETVAKYLAGDKVEKEILIPTGLYRKADAEKDPEIK